MAQGPRDKRIPAGAAGWAAKSRVCCRCQQELARREGRSPRGAAPTFSNQRQPPSQALQEARRKLRNAVVCGYMSHADRSTHLNPPDLQQLSRFDKVGRGSWSGASVLVGMRSRLVHLELDPLPKEPFPRTLMYSSSC